MQYSIIVDHNEQTGEQNYLDAISVQWNPVITTSMGPFKFGCYWRALLMMGCNFSTIFIYFIMIIEDFYITYSILNVKNALMKIFIRQFILVFYTVL